jgi:hypothetical protein
MAIHVLPFPRPPAAEAPLAGPQRAPRRPRPNVPWLVCVAVTLGLALSERWRKRLAPQPTR